MSRAISSALQTHLSGSGLTLATCLKIVRGDGVTLGLTDFDHPITFSNVVYDPLDGTTASSLRVSVGTGIDNLEVSGILQSARISDVDLLGGLFDNASISLFQVNWAESPITSSIVLATGFLGTITYEGAGFRAEIRALSQRLQQPVGELTSATCRVFQLGDTRCKVKLTAVPITAISQASPAQMTTGTAHGRAAGDTIYVQGVGGMTAVNGGVYITRSVPSATTLTLSNSSGTPLDSTGFSAYTSGGQIGYQFARTVLSVTSAAVLTFGSDPNPGGFYSYGRVTFTSGANTGQSREIRSHTNASGSAALVLQEAFPFTVAVGDAATLEAGCDRTPAVCSSRFLNIVNLRAEPFIPGNDALIRRGRR